MKNIISFCLIAIGVFLFTSNLSAQGEVVKQRYQQVVDELKAKQAKNSGSNSSGQNTAAHRANELKNQNASGKYKKTNLTLQSAGSIPPAYKNPSVQANQGAVVNELKNKQLQQQQQATGANGQYQSLKKLPPGPAANKTGTQSNQYQSLQKLPKNAPNTRIGTQSNQYQSLQKIPAQVTPKNQYSAPPVTGNKYTRPPAQNNQYSAPPITGNKYTRPPTQNNQYSAPPVSGNKYTRPPAQKQQVQSPKTLRNANTKTQKQLSKPPPSEKKVLQSSVKKKSMSALKKTKGPR